MTRNDVLELLNKKDSSGTDQFVLFSIVMGDYMINLAGGEFFEGTNPSETMLAHATEYEAITVKLYDYGGPQAYYVSGKDSNTKIHKEIRPCQDDRFNHQDWSRFFAPNFSLAKMVPIETVIDIILYCERITKIKAFY